MHELFQTAVEHWLSASRIEAKLHNQALSLAVQTLLAVSWSLALAALSFHLLEAPFLRLKRFFEYERPAREATAPTQTP